MKRLIAVVLAIVLMASLGGLAVAQTSSSVEPAEVNIVLPTGEEAEITKYVTNDTGSTVNITWEVDSDEDLTVSLAPTERLNVVQGSTANFTETISIDTWGGIPLYATVTFLFWEGDLNSANVTQKISVTEGDLDIKPGSFPNSINTNKNGVTAVALLGYEGFDVTSVNVTMGNLVFGKCDSSANTTPAHDLTDPATYAEHLQDVNYDGHTDLVSHYVTKDTGIVKNDTSACLFYQVGDSGIWVKVSDSISAHK